MDANGFRELVDHDSPDGRHAHEEHLVEDLPRAMLLAADQSTGAPTSA
jgi:hypothetical protein